MRRRRRRITQTDIDFLCLAVFGQRALPDDMAVRIALRRELALGLADALNRNPDPGQALRPGAVEALIAVG